LTPAPFAEAVLDVLGSHLHTSVYLDPGGREAYFTHQDAESLQLTIWTMEYQGGEWSELRVAEFSGQYDDNCAAFSADGQRLYFISNRPLGQDAALQPWPSVWFVERTEAGWSEPRHVGSPTDLDRDEGTLYFGASLPGGYGGSDVYRSRFVDGRYTELENVGMPVNTAADEQVALADPRGRYLILYRFERADKARAGLYASFALPGDGWSEPTYLDDDLGLAWGFDASLSPDGRTLFLLDRRVGVFWVDASVLDLFRPE
jgi:hypothetical protein